MSINSEFGAEKTRLLRREQLRKTLKTASRYATAKIW